jgi:CheY-like chemotaxis protein
MCVRSPKIIIADDNHALLRQMVSLLSDEFYVVATALDGRIALEKILQYRPDVVVLDSEMPFLNGMEVTRELRKLTPGPRVVICSVESDDSPLAADFTASIKSLVVCVLKTYPNAPACWAASGRRRPPLA